jgi:hypothetical protein
MRYSFADRGGQPKARASSTVRRTAIQTTPVALPASERFAGLQRSVGNQAVLSMLSRPAPETEEATVGDVTRRLGAGRPLEPEVRRPMETATGADLDDVRLHEGAAADELCRAFDARAFTLGTDIVIADGEYSADTAEGGRLLSHEFTHVVQQGVQPAPSAQRLEIGAVNDPSERQAESVSEQVVPQSATTALQMAPAIGGGPTAILERAPKGHTEKRSSKGGAEKGETIHETSESANIFRLQRGEAEKAVASYINGYLEATISESHRLAYVEFRSWYRSYKAAKALAEHSTAEAVCKWVFKRVISIIFPAEEVAEGAAEEAITATAKAAMKLTETIKEKSEVALDFALEHLKPNETGNVEEFLDSVGVAEELAITKLLDAGSDFRKANPALMDAAIDAFAFARMDSEKPWPTVEDVPPNVKSMLASAGIGMPGKLAAIRAAERWLAEHIRAVYESDEMYRRGRPDWDEDVVAMISSLRQMGAFENRERIYRLEQRIPVFFRSMVDLNSDSAAIMHIKLDIDYDDADAIVAHRPYASTDELVKKKVLTSKRYDDIKHLMVAVPD